MTLLYPKEIEVCGKKFIISKVPAWQGRKIFTQFIPTAAPKIGNYSENEKLAAEMMGYVGVPRETGEPLILSTIELINSHVTDWVMQLSIEKEMIQYNCENFPIGRILNLLKESFQNILPSIMSMLKDSSPSSSGKN